MTIAQLEKRIAALEAEIEELKAKVDQMPAGQRHWWHDEAGRFANDPLFEEMVRLGREYRESLHPDRKMKKMKRKKQTDARP